MKKLCLLFMAFTFLLVINVYGQGELWGVTKEGGTYGLGVIFKTLPDGTGYSVQHEFFTPYPGDSPVGQLVDGSNGKLYGVTNGGGVYDQGVLFEYDPVSKSYAKKIDFRLTINGGNPAGGLIKASNGKIYGTTEYGGGINGQGRGVLFEYDPNTNVLTNKVEFASGSLPESEGAYPEGDLVEVNGKLYGTTNGGIIYEYNINTGAYAKKVTMPNGYNSGRYFALAGNGKLYGTIAAGGLNGNGLIFEYDPANGNFTSVFDFATNVNGVGPQSGLTSGANGKLYGFAQGGIYSHGILFEFTPGSNSYTKKIDFNNTSGIGGYPEGRLTLGSNGMLYGHTTSGGQAIGGMSGVGTIFEFNPTNNTIQKKIDIISFAASYNSTGQGLARHNNLMQTSSGKMYGSAVAYNGHRSPLYEFDFVNNNLIKEFDFESAPNGSAPGGGVIKASNGRFYGFTSFGGALGGGVLYEYNPTTSTFNNRHDFSPVHWSSISTNYGHQGELVEADNGKLYGYEPNFDNTTSGYIFEFNPGNNAYQRVVTFNGTNGANPQGSLVKGENGKLYGVTYSGGINNSGVLFEYNSSSGAFTKLYDFASTSGASGSYPTGYILMGSNGKLYGTTNPSSGSGRVLFEYNIATAQYANVHSFNPTFQSYENSYGTLVEANNIIYGRNAAGQIYAYDFVNGLYSYATIPYSILDSYNSQFGKTGLGLSGNSKLYGLGMYGGIYDYYQGSSGRYGALFEYDQAAGSLTKKFDFNGLTGANPVGSLFHCRINQTITFNPLPTKNFGDSQFTLNATASSGLPVRYTSSNPSVATITGDLVTIIGAGTSVITAMQDGDLNYLPAIEVPTAIQQTLTVNKAVVSVSSESKSKVYGDLNPQLTFTYTGFVGSDGLNSLDIPLTIYTTATTASSVGTYPITFSGGADANYLISATDGSLTVSKALLTISAVNKSSFYGDAIPALDVIYSGFKNSENSSIFSIAGNTPPSISTLATQGSNAGPYAITLTGGSAVNYDLILLNGTLTINQLSQTIILGPLVLKAFGDPSFLITATGGGSNNPIIFTSSDPNVLTITGNMVTITGSGSAYIYANQAGDINYLAAPQVQQLQLVTLPKPTVPSSYIFLVNEFATQMDYYALPGDGMSRLVVLKKDGPVDFVPVDDISYAMGQTVGAGNNNFIGLVLTGAIGYGTIKNLEPGASYYVKVFEFNQSNGFYSYLTSATATSGQVTMPQQTVQLISPINNAININAPSTSFSCSSVAGATSYTIELFTNSFFMGSPAKTGTSTTVTQTITGLTYSTQYYARVKTNLSTNYGPATTFTMEPPEADAYVTTPTNGSTGNNVFLTVTSNTVSGGGTYYIELSTVSDFSTGVIAGSSASASISFTNLAFSTTYYTRVRTNLSPNWGQTRSFTTGDALSLSYITSPANNSTGNSPTLTLTANQITGAVNYTIQISPDATFNTDVTSKSGVRSQSFTNLLYNTVYYSRVSTDVVSGWGPTRIFTTVNHTFSTQPTNNSTNLYTTQTIVANAAPGATSSTIYYVELNTDSNFGAGTAIIKFNTSGGNTTAGRTQTFSNLAYGTTYYLRGRTSFSTNWGTLRSTFTTGTPETLARVTIPNNGATVSYNSSLNITAQILPGASTYTIELNTSSDFSGTSLVQTGGSNILAISGISASTQYYTRVKTNLDPDWGTTITNFYTSAPGGRINADPPVQPTTPEPMQIKIMGNPVTTELKFVVNTFEQDEVEILFTDLNGKTLHQSKEQTNTLIKLETPFGNGIYLLMAKTRKENGVVRVIKKE